MTHQQLAEAMGVSRVLVTRLAGRGMPTSSVEEAQRWRRAHTIPRRGGAAAPAGEHDLVSAKVRVLNEQHQEIALRNAKTRGELAPIGFLAEVLARVAVELGERLEFSAVQLRRTHPELPASAIHAVLGAFAEARNRALDEIKAAVVQIANQDIYHLSTEVTEEEDDHDEEPATAST
jgi:phage terminase Nu1 subunit (DNA packaging protein)